MPHSLDTDEKDQEEASYYVDIRRHNIPHFRKVRKYTLSL